LITEHACGTANREPRTANDQIAAANRRLLEAKGLVGINVMSAPGSGKTTLLQKTVELLGPARCAVLVGDLQTTRDADRLAAAGAPVVQINTGRGCHLTAAEVADGLAALDLAGRSFLFIENVGNMVCPAGFALGEHRNVVLMSLPEGDDKVAKYPTLFQAADVVLLSKIDLAGVMEFDEQRMRDDLAQVNSRAPLLRISTRSGAGLQAWLDWVQAIRPA
jgi:hydrogenase nickel incorporation protein HypB